MAPLIPGVRRHDERGGMRYDNAMPDADKGGTVAENPLAANGRTEESQTLSRYQLPRDLTRWANTKAETPCFVLHVETFLARLECMERLCRELGARYAYPMKANADVRLLRALRERETNLDLCSVQELSLARALGFPARRMRMCGAGLDKTELEYAFACKIGVDLDSLEELELAAECRNRRSIGIRVASTSAEKGLYDAKFGIPATDREAVIRLLDSTGVRLTRLHVHGVLSGDMSPREISSCLEPWLECMQPLAEVNFGGGLGDGLEQHWLEKARERLTPLASLGKSWGANTVTFEPGEAVVGPAGWLATRVRTTKQLPAAQGRADTIIITDSPYTTSVGTGLVESRYPVHALDPVVDDAEPTTCRVHGRNNNALDIIRASVLLPGPRRGMLLLVGGQGAYVTSLLGTFNGRPAPDTQIVFPGRPALGVAEFPFLAHLEDHFERLFQRLCELQNPDGGFPETYTGDEESGCWTTAELYALLSINPLSAQRLEVLLEDAERYLLGVLERHGGVGLPYYECPPAGQDGPRSSLPVVDATAAFLTGWTKRHPNEEAVTNTVTEWLRNASADGPGSGWGVRPGDRRPRTYSTANALLALGVDEGTREHARTFLSWRDPDTGAWPFRPGVDEPSRLGTAFALEILPMFGIDRPEILDRAESWLLDRLQEQNFTDEDSFLVEEGYQLSFMYAPRLVALGNLMRSSNRAMDRPGSSTPDPRLAEVAAHLARYARAARGMDQPLVDQREERTWHYIDFAAGLANITEAWTACSPAVRQQLAHQTAQALERHRRWDIASTLPWHLRSEARVLASARNKPTDKGRALATHVEQVYSFSWMTMLAALRDRGAEGRTHARAVLQSRRQGLSDLRELLGRAPSARGEDLACRLEDEWTAAHESPEIHRLHDHRNSAAHGYTLANPEGIESRVGAWFDILDCLPALRAASLVVMERLGHAARDGTHIYQWRKLDGSQTTGTVRSKAALPDMLEERRELAAVFVMDRSRPQAKPLALLPFLMFGQCPGCGPDRLLVMRKHEPRLSSTSKHDVTVTLACAQGCGGKLSLRLDWQTVLNPTRRA